MKPIKMPQSKTTPPALKVCHCGDCLPCELMQMRARTAVRRALARFRVLRAAA